MIKSISIRAPDRDAPELFIYTDNGYDLIAKLSYNQIVTILSDCALIVACWPKDAQSWPRNPDEE